MPVEEASSKTEPKTAQMIVEFDIETGGFKMKFTAPVPPPWVVNACECIKATQVLAQLQGAQPTPSRRVLLADGSMPHFQ